MSDVWLPGERDSKADEERRALLYRQRLVAQVASKKRFNAMLKGNPAAKSTFIDNWRSYIEYRAEKRQSA